MYASFSITDFWLDCDCNYIPKTIIMFINIVMVLSDVNCDMLIIVAHYLHQKLVKTLDISQS